MQALAFNVDSVIRTFDAPPLTVGHALRLLASIADPLAEAGRHLGTNTAALHDALAGAERAARKVHAGIDDFLARAHLARLADLLQAARKPEYDAGLFLEEAENVMVLVMKQLALALTVQPGDWA